jgi:hypothetical protein
MPVPSATGAMASGFSHTVRPEETPPGDCDKPTEARRVTHKVVISVFIVFELFRSDRACFEFFDF